MNDVNNQYNWAANNMDEAEYISNITNSLPYIENNKIHTNIHNDKTILNVIKEEIKDRDPIHHYNNYKKGKILFLNYKYYPKGYYEFQLWKNKVLEIEICSMFGNLSIIFKWETKRK